ncbi:MAG: C-GCAxxG-C-C family protein [Paramuribaculum sp.]|nr:C-GCAxxG-C-C family protein [Paramuribaculum sp.]MDE7236647.1 C-GCAxxG-C-C family protein [Paramuribaculum sp.]
MESRIETARERKASGKFNCAQAVACTYADMAGITPEAAAAMTNAFGSGMGNLEGTCGSIVGAGMIIGIVAGDRVKAMKAMRVVMDRFADRNGSTVCCKLKGIGTGTPLRACNDCVADAAEFLEDTLRTL